MSYSNILMRDAVVVDATTPVKIFDSQTSTRIGWRGVIPGSVGAGIGMLFYIQATGATAPTKAAVVAGPSLRAEAADYVEDGARSTLDIYAVMESGASVTITPQEILQ